MLYLHRAERTDTLADALAHLLAEPLVDPMRTEVVSVPARGVERWLGQWLATRLGGGHDGADGIAANIDFSSPARLTDVVVDAVTGGGGLDNDPWQPGALVWSVLAVLDDTIDDPAHQVLARHVGALGAASGDDAELRLGRRFATARHVADLFDQYGRQRPDMLAAWARGTSADGAGGRVPADMEWQPEFWRAVRERVGREHPAEALDAVCDRLRTDPDLVDLPERLSVFGPTRVSESLRRVLGALAAHRDVHLFIPHPSPALWQHISDAVAGASVRRCELVLPVPANPLLAGQSRDVQELQVRLMPIADVDTHHVAAPRRRPSTVLAALQDGLRDDRLDRGILPATTLDTDTSVEIHACHGADRQVDVLRDRLLHLFDADPSLQPRDVLIMCPDVGAFAPLIRGAFGQPGLGHPAFDLRVRLADRGQRQVNPVLDVLAIVVELAAGRVTAEDVIDLLSRDPVRERFQMTVDDLEIVREWLAHSGTRWGIDDTQRRRFGLAGFAQGTVGAGLDRVVLGAVAEERDGRWLGTALPLDGVESTEIDLVGRFAEFVERLGALLGRLDATGPAPQWRDALIEVVDLLCDTTSGAEWQRAQAVRLITEAFDNAMGESAPPLRLADVRDLVSRMVAGRPTRSNFRTGELTVCTMVPMRSVPHRVVILLGIDATTFPRVQRTDGDDVLARVPLVGERSPRDEDRQLFLDAVCAAEENLLVFFSGADPVSGARMPPAVVVSELADAAAAVCGVSDGSALIRRHTLHGFDARNFVDGGVQAISGPFSYDADLLAGAMALRADTVAVPSMGSALVSAPETDDVALTDLIAFIANPVEGFVRQRLGARMPADDQLPGDELDVDLDPLDQWTVGDRLLQRVLAGDDLHSCQAAELRRGTLPPFQFGRRTLAAISGRVERLFAAASSARQGHAPDTRDIVVDLPDGRRVYGTVGDVFGTALVAATYSKVRAKQRLAAWVRLLAVAASTAGGADSVTTSVLVGRPKRGERPTRSLLVAPGDPTTMLYRLVCLRDTGLRRPLPLPLDAAADYADVLRTGHTQSAAEAAKRVFGSKFGSSTDPYIRFVFGGDVTTPPDFATLLAVTVPDDRFWGAVDLTDHSGESLFCVLADQMWTPLLDHETLS